MPMPRHYYFARIAVELCFIFTHTWESIACAATRVKPTATSPAGLRLIKYKLPLPRFDYVGAGDFSLRGLIFSRYPAWHYDALRAKIARCAYRHIFIHFQKRSSASRRRRACDRSPRSNWYWWILSSPPPYRHSDCRLLLSLFIDMIAPHWLLAFIYLICHWLT